MRLNLLLRQALWKIPDSLCVGLGRRAVQMPDGTVKWFSDQKGYGFITQQGGADVFVHYSAITMDGFKTLKEGDHVQFEVAEGPKGLQATSVTVVANQ